MAHCRTDILQEQAYEDFAKGQFQNKSEGFNRLMKSYTSEVSPDRKGIITSGLKAVSKNRQNVLKPIDFVAMLLEGKVKYQKLPSGSGDYIEFYDKNGEMVAAYSNNGWTMADDYMIENSLPHGRHIPNKSKHDKAGQASPAFRQIGEKR